MPDKTALGISEELRHYIEALVEEVILEGKSFENQKKYLQRFCNAEGINYDTFEKNLTEFIESMEECKSLRSKSGERLARLLAKECFISDKVVNRMISKIGEPVPIPVPSRENTYNPFRVENGVLYTTRPVVGRVTIPSQLNGQTITDIGERAFADSTDLRSIVIPPSVLGIGREAFRDCRGLTSVIFSNDTSNLIDIGVCAFQGCIGLTSIVIPSIQLKRIGESAFLDCFNLASFDMKVIEIGGLAFRNCCSLKNIVIPNSVTKIGDLAFDGCYELEEVVIPNSVKEIGKHVFSNCPNLRTIYIRYACLLKEACVPQNVRIERTIK